VGKRETGHRPPVLRQIRRQKLARLGNRWAFREQVGCQM
jgi:hypothetical protein